jgi:SDR family mycofactocin-dependent oxidoreductase
MGRVEGKVVLITGAARGQGRSHAVRFAEEGADIIAIDICEQIATAQHTMGTDEDLAETASLVEKLDRRIVTAKADVRDPGTLRAAVDAGVAELGRLDIVSANAGIVSMDRVLDMSMTMWQDMIDVHLTGLFHTVQAAVPHILAGGRGGSVVITSSASGLAGFENIGHYTAAKHGVLGLMKTLALELGSQAIRVNAVCPSNVGTKMILNDTMMRLFMPDLENPTVDDALAPGSSVRAMNVLDVPWMEPIDISNAVLFLASDEARYVTGVALPVDAGYLLK